MRYFAHVCGVMAKRLRDVCALPESEPRWRARLCEKSDIF
jgi:hypothetical protein